MLPLTSSFVVWTTPHVSPASNQIVHRIQRCDAIEQHKWTAKCMTSFQFISLLS